MFGQCLDILTGDHSHCPVGTGLHAVTAGLQHGQHGLIRIDHIVAERWQAECGRIATGVKRDSERIVLAESCRGRVIDTRLGRALQDDVGIERCGRKSGAGQGKDGRRVVGFTALLRRLDRKSRCGIDVDGDGGQI